MNVGMAKRLGAMIIGLALAAPAAAQGLETPIPK